VAGAQRASERQDPGVQTTGVPRQAPDRHTSEVVQGLPSSQAYPLRGSIARHVPVAESHWRPPAQGPGGPQSTSAVPVQTPSRQTSGVVHESPSSQGVPSATGTRVHAPASGQTSAEQPSSQASRSLTQRPAAQDPGAWQASPLLQAVQSATRVNAQPLVGLQTANKQGSCGGSGICCPRQEPAWQLEVDGTVQASSAQGVPSGSGRDPKQAKGLPLQTGFSWQAGASPQTWSAP
jgi:hypothetical protein